MHCLQAFFLNVLLQVKKSERECEKREKLSNHSLFSYFKIGKVFNICWYHTLSHRDQTAGMEHISIFTIATVEKVTTCIFVGILGYKDQCPLSKQLLRTSTTHKSLGRVYVSSCYECGHLSSLVRVQQCGGLKSKHMKSNQEINYGNKYKGKTAEDLQEVLWLTRTLTVLNPAKHKDEESCPCPACQTT